MRTALLSALELTQEGQPRAFERLGGRSLLEWQVDLAKELGCSRILCLCEHDIDPLDDARRAAERLGLEFHLVPGPLQLVGQLTADQELLVIADGLVADRGLLVARLGEGRGILTLPDEAGIAAGFERIDADHAWGGVLVARARIAERLAELPPDSDAVSALLRLALQSGTRLVPLSAEVLESGDWLLVRNPQALSQREAVLLDRSVEQAFWRAPGIALSRRLARWLAPDWLERGPAAASALGVASLLGAIGLATIERPAAALGCFVLGNLALATRDALVTLKSRLRGIGAAPGHGRITGVLIDLALVAVLALPLERADALERLFLPLMLMGLVRLAAILAPTAWRASWSDRSLLALILLGAAWLGVLDRSLAALSLVTLAYCLFFRRDSQITQA